MTRVAMASIGMIGVAIAGTACATKFCPSVETHVAAMRLYDAVLDRLLPLGPAREPIEITPFPDSWAVAIQPGLGSPSRIGRAIVVSNSIWPLRATLLVGDTSPIGAQVIGAVSDHPRWSRHRIASAIRYAVVVVEPSNCPALARLAEEFRAIRIHPSSRSRLPDSRGFDAVWIDGTLYDVDTSSRETFREDLDRWSGEALDVLEHECLGDAR